MPSKNLKRPTTVIPVSANSDCCDLHLANGRSALQHVICNFEDEKVFISFDYVTVHGTDP